MGRQPAEIEVSDAEARAILGCGRATIQRLLPRPVARKIIKWRWLNENRHKRLYNRASLLAYLEATRNSELPEESRRLRRNP
jgi:hypothetical protein